MATVTYDDRSYHIDGRRIWLTSGTIHYFRVPAGLWRDRLLKAKRAGLNCIETYVAWNFHEAAEGKWDFTGDRDVVAFVKLCKELGLYVILRPGPYICAEWDFGGFPAWLVNKPGIAYRTNNAVYSHYFDKFFRQVLPRLAEHQVTRGGNIILIQNENEYQYTTMPDRLAYLEFISQLIRRAGFEIPIITCNYCSEPLVPGAIECVNASGNLVQWLKRLRVRQPNAPMLVTEFWSGWFDNFGEKHHTQADSARRVLEVLGCGAQYNYYMWHGGTNFGFWGARWPSRDNAFQTTSYDYDAPLAEGGGLTAKYYQTRLVNLASTHLGEILATMKLECPGVTVHDGVSVLNISGPRGRLAVVSNSGKTDIKTAKVSLLDNTELTVSLEPIGATMVPLELKITDAVTLDYSNMMPLGVFGPAATEESPGGIKVLVLHGPAGFDGRFSINGKRQRITVPAGEEPLMMELDGMTVVIVCSDLASRTWPTADSLVIGPTWLGEDATQVVVRPGAKQYAIVTFEGQLTHKKVRAADLPPAKKPAVPKLSTPRLAAVAAEPLDESLQWTAMDKPRDVDALGQHYGYVWYRAQIDVARPGERQLYFTDCHDRATVYVNGHVAGVFGDGAGAVRQPLKARLKAGRNDLVMLLDNMGRPNVGERLGERKGIFGPIYSARRLAGKSYRIQRGEEFPRRIIPRNLSHLADSLASKPLWVATMDISMSKVVPVQVAFRELDYPVAVWCNGRCVGFFWAWDHNYGQVTLGSELKKGTNRIQLMLWGESVDAKKLAAAVEYYALDEKLTERAAWSWRPWGPPEGRHKAKPAARVPSWYVSTFELPPGGAGGPLFVELAGSHKGQLYINGHNAGRFWDIGPQTAYYLPECWLKAHNELLVFDETGAAPTGSKLAIRPLGPFQQ
jgi:hypothetical protein